MPSSGLKSAVTVRGSLLALSCVLCLVHPAEADPPRAADSSHSAAHFSAAQKRAVLHYAESLALLDALTQGRGNDNHRRPLYAVTGTATKQQRHLCLVSAPSRPEHCKSPGEKPLIEASAPCVWCDEHAKDSAFKVYVRLELAVSSLRKLQTVYEQLGRDGRFDDLSEVITQCLSDARAEPEVQAVAEALHALTTQRTRAARGAALERLITATLVAAELSLTPDDLATDGGLRAAIKLAEPAERRARTHWQTAFADWASCRTNATDNGKLPSGDEEAVKRCNQRTTSDAETRRRLLTWQRNADREQMCLESNRLRRLNIARYERNACAPGLELSFKR